MIETKDLVEHCCKHLPASPSQMKYKVEIVKRLETFDKLKEAIINLLIRINGELE